MVKKKGFFSFFLTEEFENLEQEHVFVTEKQNLKLK